VGFVGLSDPSFFHISSLVAMGCDIVPFGPTKECVCVLMLSFVCLCLGAAAGIGALVASALQKEAALGALYGSGGLVVATVGCGILLLVWVCLLGCYHECADLVGGVRDFCRRPRTHIPVVGAQSTDLESQLFRVISLSTQDGSIVGSLISGKEIFRFERPTEIRSEVILAEVASALRTKTSQLRLYEGERCLSNLDVISDLDSITVKQILCAKKVKPSAPASRIAPRAQIMAPAAGTLLQLVPEKKYVDPVSHNVCLATANEATLSENAAVASVQRETPTTPVATTANETTCAVGPDIELGGP
jgi:hypothetical protein